MANPPPPPVDVEGNEVLDYDLGYGQPFVTDPDWGDNAWVLICTNCGRKWSGTAWEHCGACEKTLAAEPVEFGPTPQPLVHEPAKPDFPVDALPAWMADAVRAVAADMQCPPDLPAMLGLTALSIACTKRIKIHVRSTWYEPANTYLVTALEPGENKSPAVKVMIGPIWDHERHLRDSTASTREVAQMRREYLTNERTKKIKAGEIAEASALSDEMAELPPSEPPRLIIDDATPTALVQLMAANDERMAIVSTEGAVFSVMKGRHSKDQSADLEVYLKAYSGDGHSEARVTRDATPDLREPALTIGVTVQPSVVAELMGNAELIDRGLMPRFMMSAPDSLVGTRVISDAEHIDPAIIDCYRANIVGMLSVLDGHERIVPLSADALALFNQARQTLENHRKPNGILRPVTAWTIKLESTIIRVAGLLAAANHPDHAPDVVDADAMSRALRMADYWIGHAIAAHSLATVDPVEAAAQRIAEWVVEHGKTSLTLRDAYSINRRLTPTAADAVGPMQLLVDNYWVSIDDGTTEVTPTRRGQRGQTFTVSGKVATEGAKLLSLRAHSGVSVSGVAVIAPKCPKGDEKKTSSSSDFSLDTPKTARNDSNSPSRPTKPTPPSFDPFSDF